MSVCYTQLRPGFAGANERTVLFFGWYGAQKRHLDKFAAFYAQRDCNIIVVSVRTLLDGNNLSKLGWRCESLADAFVGPCESGLFRVWPSQSAPNECLIVKITMY